jgi:hypothetical protein
METQTLLGWIVFQFMHQFLQKKLRWVRIIFRHGILAHLKFFLFKYDLD